MWGDPSPPGVSIHLTAAFTSTTTTTTTTIAAVSVITTTDTTTSAKTTAMLVKMEKLHSAITVFMFIHITDRSTVCKSAAIKNVLSSSFLNDDDNIVKTERQTVRQTGNMLVHTEDLWTCIYLNILRRGRKSCSSDINDINISAPVSTTSTQGQEVNCQQ